MVDIEKRLYLLVLHIVCDSQLKICYTTFGRSLVCLSTVDYSFNTHLLLVQFIFQFNIIFMAVKFTLYDS